MIAWAPTAVRFRKRPQIGERTQVVGSGGLLRPAGRPRALLPAYVAEMPKRSLTYVLVEDLPAFIPLVVAIRMGETQRHILLAMESLDALGGLGKALPKGLAGRKTSRS